MSSPPPPSPPQAVPSSPHDPSAASLSHGAWAAATVRRDEASWFTWVASAAVLGGLYLAAQESYLLFHALAEIFSVVVAFSVFMFVWNARRYIESGYLLFVGVAYLFLGFLDLLHTLAYQGMTVFPNHPFSANQLWIAARGLEAVTLVAGFAFHGRSRRPPPLLLLGGYGVVTAALVASIFWWRVFPVCFVAGQGQTPFKIAAEYVIIATIGVAAWLLHRARAQFHPRVYRPLLGSLLLAAACEFAFTLYVSNYGPSNMAGHFLKILSYYLVHRAVIEVAVRQPYDLVFRDLADANEKLRGALDEIKTLRGIIPICASCKKIRDDAGSWDQIEDYLSRHSDATFSHGICPDCISRLYAGLDAPPGR